MKTRNLFAITLASAFFCALPNLAMAQSGPLESQFGGLAAPIEGTWFFTIQGAPGGTFWSLQSFTAGGVTVATGTNDRIAFGTAPISPLYGSWSSNDYVSYHVTILFFTFNSNGMPTGLFKTNESLRLKDENTLEGSGVGFSCSYEMPPTSNNCTALPGPPIKITGTRIIAQGAN
jgi:hypothetical protein